MSIGKQIYCDKFLGEWPIGLMRVDAMIDGLTSETVSVDYLVDILKTNAQVKGHFFR